MPFSLMPAWPQPVPAGATGCPTSFALLGTLDPWSLRQKRFRKQLFWRLAAKRMLGEAAAIHYTADEERRLAEQSLGLKRGVVIGLGVDSTLLGNESEVGLFRQKQPSLGSHPFVLVMSRIHPKKGLELLLQTFVGLIAEKRFQHWRLVIAGDGDPAYIQSLKQLARASRIEDHILFPGWLEGAEKVSALRSAELLALASHQENFGLCVVESLACGVPVLVSTQVNLCREIEAARAGWATPLNPKDLKEALQAALDDKEQRRQRGLAGRELVRLRFSWPAIARELITLYMTQLDIGHTDQHYGENVIHCAADSPTAWRASKVWKLKRPIGAARVDHFEWPRIAARMNMVYEAVLEERPLPSFQLADVNL